MHVKLVALKMQFLHINQQENREKNVGAEYCRKKKGEEEMNIDRIESTTNET